MAGVTLSSAPAPISFSVYLGQSRPDGGRSGQTMIDPVPEKGEEDEHSILAAIRESVADRVAVRNALDESLALHLSKPPGQDPRREAGVVSQDFSEPVQLEERHVPQDEQRPFSAEALHALPHRIGLIGQERRARGCGPLLILRLRHYPAGP